MLTMAQAVKVVGRALLPFTKKPGAKTLAAMGVIRGSDRLAVRWAIYAALGALGYQVNGALLVIEGSSSVRSLAKILAAKSEALRTGGGNILDDWGRLEHQPIVQPVSVPESHGPGAIRWTGGQKLNLTGGRKLRVRESPGTGRALTVTGLRTISTGPLPALPVRKTVLKQVPAKKASGKRVAARMPAAAKEPAAAKKPAAATAIVTATPHVEFAGDPAARGTRYPLEVYLDQQAAEAGAEVQGVVVTAPASVRSCRIEIWADASSHFVVEGLGAEPHVTLSMKTGLSDRMGCVLRVVGGARAEEAKHLPMFVAFFLRYKGRPCGKVMRYLETVDGRLRWKAEPGSAMDGVPGALPPRTGTSTLAVEHGARRADIAIEVLRTEVNDGRQFRLHCETRGGKWAGAWNLPAVTSDLVKAYMDSVMNTEEGGLVAALDGAGINLWRALRNNAPAAAKLILDALAAGAKTMSVISEEAFIPWELMVPELSDKDRSLGTRLQIGRWVTGEYIAPPQRIPMHTGYIVAPTTSSLMSSAAEVKFLSKQLHPGVQVKPATRLGLDTELGKKARDVVHFICHGKSDVLQKLLLEGTDELDSSALLGMRGVRRGFTSRPLVFLNACEVGGQRLSLDGSGGFANSFIELGAAAVVAPLWAVEDEAAGRVTASFYSDVLKGMPLARALQRIRRWAYADGATVDSFAAYCLYGDPLAVAVTD